MRRLAFLLMLASALGGCVPKSKYDALQSQYEDCQQDLKKREAVLRKWREDQQALIDELKPLIDKGIISVQMIDGRTVIAMKAEVLFPSGSAELSPQGKETVSELAKVLGKRSDADWQIEGHTDDDPISTAEFPSNWHLGSARAITVLQAMISSGMSPEHVSAATFGQYQPQTSNASDAGKAQNRRIEVVLLPDLSALPGMDGLMKEGQRRRQPQNRPGQGQGQGGGDGQRPPPRPR